MKKASLVIALTIAAVLAAGWLALRRGDIPYDTLETSYATQASQFMTLQNGLKIHYTDTGSPDRSAIVLVHGFSASLHTWADWVADLSQDYRVITLDLPGHGLSRAEPPEKATIARFAEIVFEVTQTLGVDRFTLAGNSMGGNTAWMYALAYPETLEGLILVAASGWGDDADADDSDPLIFRLLRNPIARNVMKDLDMTALTRGGLEDSYTDQSFVTDALVERYVSLSRAPGHRETLLAIMSGSRERLTAERLQPLTLPTLIMWGADDNLVPAAHADKYAAALPHADKIVYSNIGHLPQEEHAVTSIADVRAFMDRVEWDVLEDEVIEPAGDPRLGSRADGAN